VLCHTQLHLIFNGQVTAVMFFTDKISYFSPHVQLCTEYKKANKETTKNNQTTNKKQWMRMERLSKVR
jgi:hypothetical protein